MAQECIALLKNKVDVSRVIDQLNAALAEEWLAYYQYWTASKMVTGFERESIAKEFMAHAQEELAHADRVINRIIELDGIPVLAPQEWIDNARCVYDRPTEFDSEYFLRLILQAEECAMRRYQGIAEMTEGKDLVTNTLAKEILAQEADHEQDIQDYLNDLDTLRKKLMK